MISFFVPGEPRGKQRARVTCKGTYTPQETVDSERAIGWECKKAMNGVKPLEGPVRLVIEARFTRPRSWPIQKRLLVLWKISKPDVDNIVKLVGDSLNKIAWLDDAQIIELTVRKYYSESPGLQIEFGSFK
jgi:Holliday junction resolvase RusA-like endonuclease